MEFDHLTNRYLYPDRYIKMIPYFLNNYYITIFKREDTSSGLFLYTDQCAVRGLRHRLSVQFYPADEVEPLPWRTAVHNQLVSSKG
jgi:hypothetical protein